MEGTDYSTRFFNDDDDTELEKQSRKITETDTHVEDYFKDGDKVFFHHKHKIGAEEIDVDLITLTHIENESITGIDIASDAKIRLEDESGDDAYGVRIEFCEINNITRVSRVLIGEGLMDGVSTSYNDDGTVQKIEIYKEDELVETILDD